MKKTMILAAAATLAVATTSTAQNVVDAARYGATNINGTARYRSMAGAFGALGGDPTCMSDNPAGLAIYRGTNLFTITPHMAMTGSESMGSEKAKNDKTSFGVSNLAAVFSFRTPESDNLVNFTLGIGLNRRYTNNSKYNVVLDDTEGSFGDYLTNQANDYLHSVGTKITPYDAFNWDSETTRAPFLSMMAYDIYAIVDDPTPGKDGKFYVLDPLGASPSYQRLFVHEQSRNDEYNISGAWNFNDIFFLGATMKISDFNSTMWTEFDQDYSYDYSKSYIAYDNTFETRGSGVGFNLGMLWMPIDSWRIGASVHTPTWTTLTETYLGAMITDHEKVNDWSTFEDSWRYDFSTPWEYQFSTALILGTRGLLSLEYDLTDFSSMRYSESDGFNLGAGTFHDPNNAIDDYLKLQHTIKLGGEYRINKQWSARAGYAYTSSPYTEAALRGYILPESEVNWNNYKDGDDTNIQNLVYYSTTKPNFQTLDNQHYFSLGAGWRYQQWQIDASFVLHNSTYNAAAYPDDFSVCEPVKVDFAEKNIDVTVTYRF